MNVKRLAGLVGIALVMLALATALGPATFLGERPALFSDEIRSIVLHLRLPRVLLAFLSGGSLALSGHVTQLVLHNPLADPYLLGISSGATCGVVMAIGYLAVSSLPTPLASFIGGVAGLVLTLAACGRSRWSRPSMLVLAGAVASQFLAALAFLGVSLSSAPDLPGVLFWIAGDFSLSSYRSVVEVGLSLLPLLLFATVYARDLDLLETGDEEARSVGVHSGRVRILSLAFVTLATSATVAHCGMIGFVGLLVPHAVRAFVGPRLPLSAVASFLFGGSLVVAADLFARTAIPFGEIPVGIVTALMGCPFLLYLLRRKDLS